MNRATLLQATALVVAAMRFGLSVFRALGGAAGLQRLAIERSLATKLGSLFEDGRLPVFTLGTGSPQPGSGRMPAANAIVAGEELLVIDASEGASRTMGELSLPLDGISAIFITHWHSDHSSGLGALLNASWNMGRGHALNVYGSQGIDRILSGLSLVYSGDTVATPLVAKAAAVCDIPVHEAIKSKMMRGAAVVLRNNGRSELTHLSERSIDSHADTITTARIAAEAGVRMLIPTHLIPWSRNPIVGFLHTSGMAERFGGEIVVAGDGQWFDF